MPYHLTLALVRDVASGRDFNHPEHLMIFCSVPEHQCSGSVADQNRNLEFVLDWSTIIKIGSGREQAMRNYRICPNISHPLI